MAGRGFPYRPFSLPFRQRDAFEPARAALCVAAHRLADRPVIFSSSKGEDEPKGTCNMMTKLYGALIGAGIFFAVGTALAHAQALCDACF
jgi:hypothetical protein